MKHKSKPVYRPEVRAILICRDGELRIILRNEKMVCVSLATGLVRGEKQ